MSVPQNLLTREENTFCIRGAGKEDGPALMSGPTTRRVMFSRDNTSIVVIDNFTIRLHRIKDFEKIRSFKLVSETRGRAIEAENEKIEKMIEMIKLDSSPKAEEIMLKKRIQREYIQEIDISPDNRFLVSLNTYESADKPNLTIREIESDKTIFAMSLENFNPENWPVFRWFSARCEPVFCLRDRVRLSFFDSRALLARAATADAAKTLAEPSAVLNFAGEENPGADGALYSLREFSLSPHTLHFAVFLKSRKGDRPSRIEVYKYPSTAAPTASRAVSAEFAEFAWAGDGRALMARTSVNSAKSYYTVSSLLLFRLGGGAAPMAQQVRVGRSTLHDCAFSNAGDHFAVLAYDPIRPKLFRTSDCELVHEFPPFKCNRIVWSPNDRFAWIAGVHNMSGNMSFWDMKTYRCLGQGQHQGARAFSWSSDSKFFVTACLSPWRNVENGYKIWSFCGKLMARVDLDRLYQCSFVPQPSSEVRPFCPEDLEGDPQQKEFLTKKPPARDEDEGSGIRFTVPFRLDGRGLGRRASARGRAGGRGRRRGTGSAPEGGSPPPWKPALAPKKIFGLPPSPGGAAKPRRGKKAAD